MTVQEGVEYIEYVVDTEFAHFSHDGRYRYFLKRHCPQDLNPNPRGICMFLGNNPSRAGAEVNDLTVTKTTKWATIWGFNWMWMLNLFGGVSTDPDGLDELDDPIGDFNDRWIIECARMAERVVCAYGDLGAKDNRARLVERKLIEAGLGSKLMCFGLTKAGYPKHPSRIAYATPIVNYVPRLVLA